MSKTRVLLVQILAVAAICIVPASADAQAYLRLPARERAVSLGFEVPLFRTPNDFSFYTSIVETDVLLGLGGRKTLQVGLPWAVAGATIVNGTSVYAGNLRATVLFGTSEKIDGFVGVTVPTGSNLVGPQLAQAVGGLLWSNQAEKWSDDVFSVRGSWLPSKTVGDDRELGLGVGGAAVTENNLERLALFARLDGWLRFPVGRTHLRLDLSTSFDVTGDDGFGQQLRGYVGLAVEWPGGPRQPFGFIRIPLDSGVRQELLASAGWAVLF